MIKNLGKLKQWTEERLGAAKATMQTEDFQRLEVDTEKRRIGFEKIMEAADTTQLQLSKKKPSPEDAKIKVSPMESLGTCWVHYGDLFDVDVPPGMALTQYGQALTRVSSMQEDFSNTMREGYISTLQRGCIEYKEYQALRKKMESRRLDYDAKLGRLQKSKKEKPEWEQEMQASKMKYEETEYDLIQKMVYLQDFEEEHAESLYQLLEAHIAFYTGAVEALGHVKAQWQPVPGTGGRTVMARTPSATSLISQQGGEDYFMQTPERTGLAPRSPSASPSMRGKPLSHQSSTEGGMYASSPSTPHHGLTTPPPGGHLHAMPHRMTSHSSLRSTEESSVGHSVGHFAPQMPRRRSQSTSMKKRRKAMYDFEGETVDELSFRVGDVITVLEQVDEGWWLGEVENNGPKRRGIFPVNYTEDILNAPPMPIRPSLPASTPPIHEEPPHQTQEQTVEASPFQDTSFSSSPSAYTRPAQPIRVYSSPYTSPAVSRQLTASSSSSTVTITAVSHTHPSPSPSAIIPQATKPTHTATRTPPPPPTTTSSSSARASPALSRSFTTATHVTSVPSVRMPPPPPPPSSQIRPPQQPMPPSASESSCQECGCIDFSANVFKKGQCNNCFHKH